MTRRVSDLSKLRWELGRAPRQTLGGPLFPDDYAPVDDRASVDEWSAVHIPGNIRSHLITLGQIPDVSAPGGIDAGRWVDDYDWWYRARLSGAEPDDQIVLEADGIDYYSAVWLDGISLGTHAGMFSRQHIVLSPWICDGRDHELAIRVWGGGALPDVPDPLSRQVMRKLLARLNPGIEYFPDRMATPKAQFSFGWDFAPRLLTAGIWDDMRLVHARGAYIEDCSTSVELLSADEDPTAAIWHVKLRVTRWATSSMTADIVVAPENFVASGYQSVVRTIELCSGDSVPCTEEYELSLGMGSVFRWWPWDQGQPNLYRVTVTLRDRHGVLDEISQSVGARSIEREELGNGGRWRFRVNGRAVFLRGANWVPADILPGRLDAVHYKSLLDLAKSGGVNFLRIWGGGLREKRSFWDALDRLGIMAWQEFPLACAFLDHYPHETHYRLALSAEAEGMVRALRNHPSLIAWCGGNEINPLRELVLLSSLRDIVRRNDPDRIWLHTSPAQGDIHYWNTWHGFAPWSRLESVRTPFMSEFGFQALPDAATVREIFPEDVPPLTDARWGERKAQTEKLAHYAGLNLGHGNAAMTDQQLRDAIVSSQRVQSAGLKLGLETCRLRRDASGIAPTAPCGGVAFWQFNEPWRSVSWSIVDWAGRPKAAYHMLLQSYQPLLIAARFPWRRWRIGEVFDCAIWIVNDGPTSWDDAEGLAVLDGAEVWRSGEIAVPALGVHCIGKFVAEIAVPPESLILELRHSGQRLTGNRYDLSVHLTDRQPLKARFNRWLADRMLGAG